jgi:hypothetical protein
MRSNNKLQVLQLTRMQILLMLTLIKTTTEDNVKPIIELGNIMELQLLGLTGLWLTVLRSGLSLCTRKIRWSIQSQSKGTELERT